MLRLVTFLLLFGFINPVGMAETSERGPNETQPPPRVGNDSLIRETYQERLSRYAQIQNALRAGHLRRQASQNEKGKDCGTDIKKLSEE